jgi:hypothetical protein
MDTLPALQFTPPSISLDFEALEQRIKAITDQYTGLLVQESDIAAIKSEMAGLNKLKDMLAVARKDAVEKISKPIREFEIRIKALEVEITETRTMLDDQVKVFVQAERESKRSAVQFQIDFIKDELKCPEIDIPIQDKWLNKTAKDRDIQAEIKGIITAYQKEQLEKAAFEQARRDRAGAIENHVIVLNSRYDWSLPVTSFLTDDAMNMTTPLSNVLSAIEDTFAKEGAARAARTAALSAPQQTTPAHEAQKPVTPPAQKVKKRMVIQAVYFSENGEEIGKLYQLIKGLCVECKAQVAEINTVPF